MTLRSQLIVKYIVAVVGIRIWLDICVGILLEIPHVLDRMIDGRQGRHGGGGSPDRHGGGHKDEREDKIVHTEVDCLDFKKGLLIQCLGGNRLRSMFPLELISR